MAYEDFTTYTEFDEGDDVTVDSATKVSWVNLNSRQETAYLYKDKGINYFDGDFTHRFEMQFSNIQSDGRSVHWMLANAIGDMRSIVVAGGDGCAFYVHDDTEAIYLQLFENGAAIDDEWPTPGPQPSTTYFIEIVRDDDGGANSTGRVTAYIRTGSHSGALQVTLVVDCSVGEQNDYRYIYAVATNDQGGSLASRVTGYTQNLDTSEVVVDYILIADSGNFTIIGTVANLIEGRPTNDWKVCKDQGSWDFTEQEDKWGYLNNPRWSSQADAQEFCEKVGLSLDSPEHHLPCGHWHKQRFGEPGIKVIPTGRWVAALPQPDTSYIYLYDIGYRAAIKIEVSATKAALLKDVLPLDSLYDLDAANGGLNGQKGGYCMNKDGKRLWYLVRDGSDCQLIEIDITRDKMSIVRKTSLPGIASGAIGDGCSDNTHTYWSTILIAGQIIKIRNSDHAIIDNHFFEYPLAYEGGGEFDQGIATIDYDENSGNLFWVYNRDHIGATPGYNACRHFIGANTDLSEIFDNFWCASLMSTPGWQNMIRIRENVITHHRSYHPMYGFFVKRDPADGSVIDADYAGQELLLNIFEVKEGRIYTLVHQHISLYERYLYCIDFSDFSIISRLCVREWTAPWGNTGVSAMSLKEGVIAISRFNPSDEKNYVACFAAGDTITFLNDTPLWYMETTGDRNVDIISDEPQVWTMKGTV